MPRETVPHYADGENDFIVQVGWQRDQDMQVGITTPEGHDGQYHLVDHFYGSPPVLAQIGASLAARLADQDSELSRAIAGSYADSDVHQEAMQHVGRQVLDIVTGSGEGPSIGLWWTPSRYQVNALIRLLRKARDAAHGRDE